MTGKQLRNVREKVGWTQVEMAKQLRVAPNTVARWERDERSISKPMAKLIEAVFRSQKERRFPR